VSCSSSDRDGAAPAGLTATREPVIALEDAQRGPAVVVGLVALPLVVGGIGGVSENRLPRFRTTSSWRLVPRHPCSSLDVA
jgi:hypothetical protein